MIVEYIRYKLKREQTDAFEKAYAASEKILTDCPNCLGYEVAKGIEEPENYIVKILWDSFDGHLQGFRKGATFPEFFALVKPFFNNIEEMKHYEVITSNIAAK